MSEMDNVIGEAIRQGILTPDAMFEEAGFTPAEYENVSEPPIQWTRPNRGGEQKPAVTREQYEAGRAVLDALPPGYYVKCAGCGGWYMGGEFVLGTHGPMCGGCRQ